MNEVEMQTLEPQAGETLERTLARYARVRLDPSAAASRRSRAAVMEQAWRRRLALTDAGAGADVRAAGAGSPTTGAGSPTAADAPGRRRVLFPGWGARRISASLAAAMLVGLVLGSTGFAASRAGGPLYDARLTFEELALPSDAASRVEVEIAWAQARLAEIVEAASHDDQGALSAALAAYERTVDTLGATIGEPAERALEAVASHRAVLARVAAAAPASALGGLDRALAASDTAIGHLSATEAGQPGDGAGRGAGDGNAGSGSNGGANGNTGSGSNGGANGNANGNANGDANAGSGANGGANGNAGSGNATEPLASPTPKPEATPRPGRTPAPRPTKAPDDPQRRSAPPVAPSPVVPSPPTGKP